MSCACDGPSSIRKRPAGAGPSRAASSSRAIASASAWPHGTPRGPSSSTRSSATPRILGGSSNDEGFGIAVDAAGNAYVTGYDHLRRLPGVLAAGRHARRRDRRFVTKLDPTGTTVLYSTYLGAAVTIPPTRSRWTSTAAPTWPARRRPKLSGARRLPGYNRGLSDAFVTKLGPSGSCARLLDVSGRQRPGFRLRHRGRRPGNAYVTGSTASAAFPNNNAITCLGTKSTGTRRVRRQARAVGVQLGYCRFIGGSGEDVGQAIATDAFGNVWVVGSTTSGSIQPQSVPAESFGGQSRCLRGAPRHNGAVVYLTLPRRHTVTMRRSGWRWTPPATRTSPASTSSTNFPTLRPLQPAPGRRRRRIRHEAEPAGTGLVFSTYLGGSGDDVGNGIGVHPADSTRVRDRLHGLGRFPDRVGAAEHAGRRSRRVRDQAERLRRRGWCTRPIWAAPATSGAGHRGGRDGVAFLTGSTQSAAFPTVAPIQNAAGCSTPS